MTAGKVTFRGPALSDEEVLRLQNSMEALTKWTKPFEDLERQLKEPALLASFFTLMIASSMKRKEVRPSTRQIYKVAQLLDLILESKDAEAVIGDLFEQFEHRHAANPGHAIRWLWAQTGWIVFNRAIDLMRRVMAAKAGR